jgi:hypothetical protein
LETRAKRIKKFADGASIPETRIGETPVRHRRRLGERDQRFCNTTQLLRFGQGGTNLLVRKKGHSHVCKHGFSMAGVPTQYPADLMVTHNRFSLLFSRFF